MRRKIMNMMFSIICFLMLFLISFPNSIIADDSILQFKSERVINVIEKNNSFIQIEIAIKKTGYIYGNPKGPGTGKNTIISAVLNSETIKELYLSPSEKYYPESSPDWVNIFKNSFSIFIPVNYESLENENTLSLTIDALYCTDNSCTPVKISETFKITKDVKNSRHLLAVLPSDAVKINSASINEKKTETQLNIDFQPIELKQNNITGLFTAILFGLLAGLFLNFMPCVLPVISLKILSFMKNSNQESRKIKFAGLFFTLGIISSFLFLSTLIAFFGLNWGAIFQSSQFIIIITAIMFIMALSLFGVFTLSIPSFAIKSISIKTGGIYSEAFLHGLIATLLATPCSGPFLGATLAWTLTQPIFIIYSVFISIAIGMSFPYLLLSFNPKLLKHIPKPGQWMIDFEKFIGILVIAAVIYFLSLLNSNILISVLWTLFFIYIAFKQYGKFGNINNNSKVRSISIIMLIIIIAAGYFLPPKLLSINQMNKNETQQYSDNLLLSIPKNEIYLIKFTADWCINCRVLDTTLYNTEKFQSYIIENNIKVITADLSENNPEAESLMNQLGSKSIPFAAVFSKDNITSPIILRDIYSLKDIKNATGKIKNNRQNLKIETLEF